MHEDHYYDVTNGAVLSSLLIRFDLENPLIADNQR